MSELITVYIVSNGQNIKIGKTKDLKTRMKTLQTGNSEKLRVLYLLENVPSHMEKTMHDICRKYRLEGEWFRTEAIDHLMKHDWYATNLKRMY